MSMLVASEVNVKRGDAQILHDVGFEASAGELTVILGAPESGKSTLLYALSGFLPLAQGSVSLDNVVISEEVARFTHRIGVVPRGDEALPGPLRVQRALEYTADLRMVDHDAAYRAQRVADVLQAMQIVACADARISTLSDEQKRRVGVATELLTQPEVLYLDEPTLGLEPEAARALMCTLRERADEGCIVILTAQHGSAIELCDRVYVLEGGRVTHHDKADASRAHLK